MQTYRLYIGNISKQLADSLESLETRLAKYGTLTSKIELKTKETFDGFSYFGYLNMESDEERIKKLLTTYNKVSFMGSILRIQRAKPSYEERVKAHQEEIWQDCEYKEKLLQDYEMRRKLLEKHISEGKSDKVKRLRNYLQVSQGAIRKDERTGRNPLSNKRKPLNINDISYRVLFPKYDEKNGKYTIAKRLVKPQFKQKLWGYDKDKYRTDLVYKFQNGIWFDGNNHVVENSSKDQKQVIQSLEKKSGNEVKKTKTVLESFLNDFDFEKPADFDYTEDRNEKLSAEREKFDYEAESKVYIPPEDLDLESESDDNNASAAHGTDQQKNEPTTNDLDNLKSVFNPQDSGFSFGLNDSDIEDEAEEEEFGQNNEAESAPQQTSEPEVEVQDEQNAKGLFFPHFESPFLVAQTQLSKLQPFIKESESVQKWLSQFDETRVDLMKGFKKRRRDVLRQTREKVA